MFAKLRWLAGLTGALLSTGCATTVPRLPDPTDQPIIDWAWPYAQIAYNAYHREEEGTKPPAFKLPFRFEEQLSVPNQPNGLAYDIFREARSDGPVTIFAFRGTEGDPVKGNCDWYHGNLRRHQHDQAVQIVAEWLRQHPTAPDRLIFVGHSLGGGLATHLSFRYPGSWVFAFNPSPQFKRPDGWQPNVTDRYPFRRFAVAQRYEILKIGRMFRDEPNRFYLPVQCSRGSPIDRHSMRSMAACLTRLAASSVNLPNAAEAARSLQQSPGIFSASPVPDHSRQPPECVDSR